MNTLVRITPENLKTAKKNRDSLNNFLNIKPKKEWVKTHPITKNRYIPIEIIENNLTSIFQSWNIEVKEVTPIFNSVAVTVRVHYQDPITGEMTYQDGVGASPMQSDRGTALSTQTIKTSAVQMALPSAKTYAIKDAVEHIGVIFGRDLNRQDVQFTPIYKNGLKEQEEKEDKRIKKSIESAKTAQELEQIENQLIDAGMLNNGYQKIINSKKKQI